MTFEQKLLTVTQSELTEYQKKFAKLAIHFYEEQGEEQRSLGASFVLLIHPVDLIQLAAKNKKDCFTFHNGRVFTTIGLTSYMQENTRLNLQESFFELAESNMPLPLKQIRDFYTQTFLAVLGFELLQPDALGNKVVSRRNVASKIAQVMKQTFQYDSILTPFGDQEEKTLPQCLYEMHIRHLYQSLPDRMDTFLGNGQNVVGIIPSYGIHERILYDYYKQILKQKKQLGVCDNFIVLLGGGLYPCGVFSDSSVDMLHWKDKIYQPLMKEAFSAGTGSLDI